jgi:hypothetical protein
MPIKLGQSDREQILASASAWVDAWDRLLISSGAKVPAASIFASTDRV